MSTQPQIGIWRIQLEVQLLKLVVKSKLR